MQVSGGSQSFNAVNTLRLLGRWMRMFTIPNQSNPSRLAREWQKRIRREGQVGQQPQSEQAHKVLTRRTPTLRSLSL